MSTDQSEISLQDSSSPELCPCGAEQELEVLREELKDLRYHMKNLIAIAQQESGIIKKIITRMLQPTPEEWQAGVDRELDDLGITYDELAGQARRRNFQSYAAANLWVVIGTYKPGCCR